MSFNDYLSIAVQNIDDDLPDHLIPLTIFQTAAQASHMWSDMVSYDSPV
jgi:hypothetical protein